MATWIDSTTAAGHATLSLIDRRSPITPDCPRSPEITRDRLLSLYRPAVARAGHTAAAVEAELCVQRGRHTDGPVHRVPEHDSDEDGDGDLRREARQHHPARLAAAAVADLRVGRVGRRRRAGTGAKAATASTRPDEERLGGACCGVQGGGLCCGVSRAGGRVLAHARATGDRVHKEHRDGEEDDDDDVGQDRE